MDTKLEVAIKDLSHVFDYPKVDFVRLIQVAGELLDAAGYAQAATAADGYIREHRHELDNLEELKMIRELMKEAEEAVESLDRVISHTENATEDAGWIRDELTGILKKIKTPQTPVSSSPSPARKQTSASS